MSNPKAIKLQSILISLSFLSKKDFESLLDAVLDEDFRRNGGMTYSTEEWDNE